MLPDPLMAVAVVKGPVAEGSFNVVKIWIGMTRRPLMVSPARARSLRFRAIGRGRYVRWDCSIPSPAGCPPGDQPRAIAPAALAHPRARAGLRSFKFPSMVKDRPKEVPKSAASSPQHADR